MSEVDILIVDDEPFFCHLLQNGLSLKYRASSVSSGKEALEVFPSLNPDIVLLDIEMPDMDGYSVCREIRRLESGKDTSIVFVSGHDTLEERLKGYQVGAVDFISKPFEIGEVLAKVAVLKELLVRWKSLKRHGNQAQTLAVQAYSDATWYAATVDFQRNVFSVGDIRGIATLLIDILNELALKCCVEIRSHDKLTLKTDGLDGSPLEVELMDALKNKGETADYQNYRCYNKRSVSILIRKQDDGAADAVNLDKTLIALVETAEAAVTCFMRGDLLNRVVDGMSSLMTSMVIHRQRMERGLQKLSEEVADEASTAEIKASLVNNIQSHLGNFATDSSQLEKLLQKIRRPLSDNAD